jgi:putative redox protein
VKAVVESAGGVASRVRIGAHEVVFDQPPSVPGGQDRGPSPLDMLVVSVGACAHYFAAAFLLGRGLSAAGVRVEVESAKERQPSPRIGKLAIRLVLPPEVPESYLPAIERAVRNCPAYGTLVHAPDVELYVERQGGEAPASAGVA